MTSWRAGTPAAEQLFLSSKAVFKPPKAIRGGIPICWPQFSDMGPLGQHGFARNSPWALTALSEASATLELVDSEASREKGFTAPFRTQYRVELRPSELSTQLTVENPGEKSLMFTTALHTYLRVAAVGAASVAGLHDLEYMDNLAGRARCTDAAAKLVFDQEASFPALFTADPPPVAAGHCPRARGGPVRPARQVDRIYLSAPDALQLVEGTRQVEVRKVGLPDAVLWNPWVAKAAAMEDFGDSEYQQMVCIEAAAVASPVVVLPHGAWSAGQTLTLRALPSKQRSGSVAVPQRRSVDIAGGAGPLKSQNDSG